MSRSEDPQCSGRQGPDCESTAHAQAGSVRGRGSMASEVVWVADSIAPKMAILGRFVRFLAPTMTFSSFLISFSLCQLPTTSRTTRPAHPATSLFLPRHLEIVDTSRN